MGRRLKHFIHLLEALLVLLVFLLAYNFLLPVGEGQKVLFFDANTPQTVLKTLKKNGYSTTRFDAWLIPKAQLPIKGWYHIGHNDEGRWHFFHALKRSPLSEMRIIVYPGETHREILSRLANDMKLDPEKLQKIYKTYAHYPEGEILAGTYTLARSADENTTLNYLFERSNAQFDAFKTRYFDKPVDAYTFKLLMIIASIIQKESNKPEEMPLISSVIYNRIEKGMKLQMDGTLNYGNYSHRIVTPERIKEDATYYNTYRYKGLPPAPLASFSMEALKAALFPARSDFLFFMLTPDGSHSFAADYATHLKNLKAFREYQKKRKAQLDKDANATR